MNELDTVVLTTDLPEHRLTAGDIGTIVHEYNEESAVEVEFMNASGTTLAVATLDRKEVRPMEDTEILHARPFASS